jgi:hypothetical protein
VWKLNSCWRAIWAFTLQSYSDVRGSCHDSVHHKQTAYITKFVTTSLLVNPKNRHEIFLHSLKLGIRVWYLQSWEKNVASIEWSPVHPLNMAWSRQCRILSGTGLCNSPAQALLLKCGTEIRVPSTLSTYQFYELPASSCTAHLPIFPVTVTMYLVISLPLND